MAMRLIDADALKQEFENELFCGWQSEVLGTPHDTIRISEVFRYIDAAPTVLTVGADLANELGENVPTAMSIVYDYEQAEEATEE